MTPTISGIVSGGAVALAWFIGFIIYFYKRHRREKRARALGFRSHREMLDPPKKPEAFIIPPDPAIVEAGLHPGDRIYDDPKVTSDGMPKHAHTLPLAEREKTSDSMIESPPHHTITHSATEPPLIDHPLSPGEHSRPAMRSPKIVSAEMVIPPDV
jgi:hypothetical protein